MVELTLPWPPSVNQCWRHIVIRGRSATLLSRKGREYREKVYEVFGDPMVAFDGRLRVSIDMYPPTRRVCDVDNYLKAPFDALTYAGVWRDDSQIDELHIHRREVVKGGKLVVRIEEVVS